MFIVLARWLLLIPTAVFAVALGIALYGTVLQRLSGDAGFRLGFRTIGTLVREAAGRLLILGISPLGRIEPVPSPRAGSGDGHPPVVLVPGYGTNRTVFWFLCTFLGHRGWRWLMPVNHAGKEVRLDEQARALDRHVQRLKAASGSDRVDLVGFSMGGLIGAWYVTHGGAEHVRRLITVGTPWTGTRFARFARTAAGAELGPGSTALVGLDPTAVPTTAIWSPDDPVVIPASAAAPEGCVAVRVDGAGHLDLMLSGRVFRAIQQALEAR